MSVIDDYLKQVDPSQRTELERIRKIAQDLLPGFEEVISYNMPTIKYKGKSILGFDAHKNHVGIYPYSGSVIKKIKELADYETTTGAVREKANHLLPKDVIEEIIWVRLAQLNLAG